MIDIEKQLRDLKKVTIRPAFRRRARNRLLSTVQRQQNERWFTAFLKRLGLPSPSDSFVLTARQRVMAQITLPKPSFSWIAFLQRTVASTLVMILAVTSTLFFVDGQQVVNAAQETYLEVLSGEVNIKRSDRLMWDRVGVATELSVGDLIRVNSGAFATIRFFDDTQLHLSEDSTLLISRLESSPTFNRQGNIEVSLHQGRAWVQTLNVDDAFAGFTLITRDAIVRTLNSSFDTHTTWDSPSRVSVFKNTVNLTNLHPDTREVLDSFVVKANHHFQARYPVPQLTTLSEQDRVEGWVSDNLKRDHDHLVLLREREFENFRRAAGVLPGHMLYPLKLAKERFDLALSFGEHELTATQIDIANKRLNEAIVLLENGQEQRAWEALMAYQGSTRHLLRSDASAPAVRTEISQKIITRNQKALVAALPTDAPVRLVTEALNQTEELIAESPLAREEVRLQNSIERLQHVADLVAAGDLAAAKLSLVDHQLVNSTILDQAAALENDDRRNTVLQTVLILRQQQADLLEVVSGALQSHNTADSQLLALVKAADQQARQNVEDTIAFIVPIAPTLVVQAPAIDKNAQAFVDKVSIYKTWQGQKNQINRLLKANAKQANDIEFLQQVRSGLNDRAQTLINSRILELQRLAKVRKHKAIKQKLDRAKRSRL